MPPCLNDPKKSYTGEEPSPKGHGYCAHAEKMYEIRYGNDDFDWIVIKTKTGIKRWVRLKIPNEFMSKFKKLDIKVKLSKGKGTDTWWQPYFYNGPPIDCVTIKKITLRENGKDFDVHHTGPWNIYNDSAFKEAIEKIMKSNVDFTEQGMQKNYKASMEMDNKDIIKLIKHYM